MNRWIDIHTHLNFLEHSPEEALRLAAQEGVERMITIGTCPDDHPVVLRLAETHAPQVYCTLGVHPHEAHLFDAATEKFLRDNLNHPRVVAVGEIGLDYYYDNSPRDVQQQAFRRQLEIAAEFSLPVEIHTRDAEQDTLDILSEFNGRVRGLIHCFTGTQELADGALDLGMNISFSGVVTFKNADALREVVKRVPLDRLHVETDAPFLTPVPFRGKKNTPAFVVHTAAAVAQLKQVPIEDLAQQTARNAKQMFKKLEWNWPS